ncbi:MAG: ATP-binding cassette domain-containing protein [Actinobacteria bacterium]|nr:ATP-binding cassette domain-containing protein [Actinomycetota bacterium]
MKNKINKTLIEMRNIYKNFGHIVALENVDFYIYENEVLGLVGDNGAGKSTLVKILAGSCIPDKGDIYFDDKLVKIHNPHDSNLLGIGTVYQDLALVDCLDVSRNLFLGREPLLCKVFVNKRKMDTESKEIINRIGINIESVNLVAGYLSGGQRQSLAIGRTVSADKKILLLDEPTAALGIRESENVFKIIHRLKEEGHSIVIISHNLEHVFSLVDRIFVLRQGKYFTQ